MTQQNEPGACNCGKVKVTLMDKRNAVEALTAPSDSVSIAIDSASDLLFVNRADKAGYKQSTAYRVIPLYPNDPPLNKLWADM